MPNSRWPTHTHTKLKGISGGGTCLYLGGKGRRISVSSKLAWSTQKVLEQPELLNREPLSQKKRIEWHFFVDYLSQIALFGYFSVLFGLLLDIFISVCVFSQSFVCF